MKAFLKRHLPSPFWRQIRLLNHKASRALRASFEKLGVVVALRNDYYSPLPSEFSFAENVKRWAKPSALAGLNYNLEAMKSHLKELRAEYYEEFLALPKYAELCEVGFGPGYPHVDAFTSYAMVRKLKPSRYLEVGSGLSTYYCHLARKRNVEGGCNTQITCVEPYPYPKLREIEQIEVICSEVQDVPLQTFQSLQSGDILFIDSSHAAKSIVMSSIYFLRSSLSSHLACTSIFTTFRFRITFLIHLIIGRSCGILDPRTGRCFGMKQ